MRGRKPKPAEQRLAEGNPGKRAIPEPVSLQSPEELLLEPPGHLHRDAKALWRRVAPVLHQVGVLDGVDHAALEMATTAYARFRQAGREIASEGLFEESARGHVKENAAAAAERQAMATFLRFAEQYGLTPVARTRLGLAELERRSMADEMGDRFGKPEFTDADADEVEEAEVVA